MGSPRGGSKQRRTVQKAVVRGAMFLALTGVALLASKVLDLGESHAPGAMGARRRLASAAGGCATKADGVAQQNTNCSSCTLTRGGFVNGEPVPTTAEAKAWCRSSSPGKALNKEYGWLKNKACDDGICYDVLNDCPRTVTSDLDVFYPGWAIVAYVVLVLWVFLGIAIVCDDHFCAGLEVICEVLDLDEAVAGATFMAAGSSAPELATSLVTIFTTKDSTGLGTILGSAVFNLVMIVCLSGIAGAGPPPAVLARANAAAREEKIIGADESLPEGLYLDWRPLARDASFYVVSILICVVFAITPVGNWDKKVNGVMQSSPFTDQPGFLWYEGGILCLCYFVYLKSMIDNDKLMSKLANKFGFQPHIRVYVDSKNADDDAEDQAMLEASGVLGVRGGSGGEHTQWHGGTGAAVGLAPATKKSKGGIAEESESLTAGEAVQDDDVKIQLKADGDKVEIDGTVIEMTDSNKAMLGKMTAMQAQIETLQKQVAPLLITNTPEFKEAEKEEEGGDIGEFIYQVFAVPWEIAFKLTIPTCDRDSFQVWDEPQVFADFSADDQADISKTFDETDGQMFQKGKFPKDQVSDWYMRSKRYGANFTMSVVWIGITSALMVFAAHKLACHLGIGSYLMGLVVLAAGTSIPDALSSVVVAKEGEGDMAVANAIGSNVFNIFLGIGLPMILTQMIYDEPYVVRDKWPIIVSSIMLIVITIIMYIALYMNRWILSPKLSWGLLIMFPIYIVLNVLLDNGTLELYSWLDPEHQY